MKYIFTIIVAILLVFGGYYVKKPTLEISNETKNLAENSSNVQAGERVLDLSGKALSKVPPNIFQQNDIVSLDLSNNNLDGALPAEIRKLSNLKFLNLSNNKFTGVPAEIGQLSRLEVLDLSDNQITGLPYELGNLSNLRLLNLSGNFYSKTDLEIIKNKLPIGVVVKTE